MTIRKPIDVFRPVIYEDAIQEAAKTMRNGWIGAGIRVEEFEGVFSQYLGAKSCVAVNSGTSALHLAIRCLNLPRNSRVITSAISHVSTVNAILYEGCTPVFADVERETGNISVESINEIIDDGIKAVVCTHIGGYPCDLDGLKDVSSDYGIPLVEDCAHSIGSYYKGKRLGDGEICCFSFGFPKAITGIEGGAVVTRQSEIASQARILRNLGLDDERKYAESDYQPQINALGFRYIWNDVMASVAIKQLRYLDKDNIRRRKIAETYLSGLSGLEGFSPPKYKMDCLSSYFFIPLFFQRRDDLIRKLDKNGIRTRIYFRKYFDRYHSNQDNLPNADWYSHHELTLPINTYISDEEVGYILKLIKEGW